MFSEKQKKWSKLDQRIFGQNNIFQKNLVKYVWLKRFSVIKNLVKKVLVKNNLGQKQY